LIIATAKKQSSCFYCQHSSAASKLGHKTLRKPLFSQNIFKSMENNVEPSAHTPLRAWVAAQQITHLSAVFTAA